MVIVMLYYIDQYNGGIMMPCMCDLCYGAVSISVVVSIVII